MPWAADVRPWNPLHDEGIAVRSSCYLEPSAQGLRSVLGRPCTAHDLAVHQRFKDKLLERDFACVAARSVLNRSAYRMGVYETLGSTAAAFGLCHDLYEFNHEFARRSDPFTSFVAAFRGPKILSESAFETLLWQQLQKMHGIDARYFEWDRAVSKDPQSPAFSFSIGGRAFYVVGMNPCASRRARHAEDESFLVFNAHDQFESLRASGRYGQLQKAIRERDIACQGSINPMLDDFGGTSEARQYAGRAVPAGWRCPFHHQGADEASPESTKVGP